jgi:hypothetical protein
LAKLSTIGIPAGVALEIEIDDPDIQEVGVDEN